MYTHLRLNLDKSIIFLGCLLGEENLPPSELMSPPSELMSPSPHGPPNPHGPHNPRGPHSSPNGETCIGSTEECNDSDRALVEPN